MGKKMVPHLRKSCSAQSLLEAAALQKPFSNWMFHPCVPQRGSFTTTGEKLVFKILWSILGFFLCLVWVVGCFRGLQPHTIHWPYKYPLDESGKLLPSRTTQHLNYFISWKFSCYFTLYSEQDPYCTTMTYSSESKKGYHRGLGHARERLEQESWNESIL